MRILKKIVVFIYWNIIYNLFCLLPLQNKIFFESFLGKDYSDNPKYIYEYLLNNNYQYKYVWSFKKDKTIKIFGAKSVKKMSLKYLYDLATAKYIINNSRMPLKWRKRQKQIYVQTWHGTPLKRLVYDMENITLPNTNKETYYKNFTKDVNKWNYLVSPNEYSTSIFQQAFQYQGQIIKSGYPRNEVLYDVKEEEIVNLKKQLNIDITKKVILYAPTFRDNKYVKKSHYIQDINIDLTKLKVSLGENIILLLKNHYLVKEINYKYENNDIIDVSAYDNINDLYQVSDLLITDYSSVFFDYLNLQKPVIFYQYDQQEYQDDIRGFYIPLEDLPGAVVTEEEELYQELQKIKFTKYITYKEFLNKYNLKTYSEQSSKIIVNEVLGEKWKEF
ncbi:MAG: CDP-glycerol glycerophosphotransferase family protein [Mycoplasmatales bacterium]